VKTSPTNARKRNSEAFITIQKLYVIEKQTSDQPAEVRQRVCQEKSKPIADKLYAWLTRSLPIVPRHSPLKGESEIKKEDALAALITLVWSSVWMEPTHKSA